MRMLYDESQPWEQLQIERLGLSQINNHNDLLQHAIYTNALHGSGYDMTGLSPKPTVSYWQGLDMESTYRHNMNTPLRRELLEQHGWADTEIRYELNSWGFRSEGCREFDSITEPTLVTLGCSFTFGTGLPESDTWPRMVADAMGWQTANLGTGGHGLALGTRWLLTQGDRLANPAAVAVYIPPPGRITWINRYADGVIGNTFSMTEFQHYALLVNNIDINSFSTYMGDIAAIKLWAKSRNIPVLIYDVFPCPKEQSGLARDLQHNGVAWQRAGANAMIKNLVDILGTR